MNRGQQQLRLRVSTRMLDELFAVLGLKRGRTVHAEVTRLRNCFLKRGWRLHTKWSSYFRQKPDWDELRKWSIERPKVTGKNLEFLRKIAAFLDYQEFSVDHHGFRQYFLVNEGKINPSKGHSTEGKPFLTPGASLTIVKAILNKSETELPLFIGIHPYLDHAIELKLKGQLEV